MPKTQYQSSQGASDLDPPDRGVFRETGFVFGSISGAVPLGSGPAPQKAPLSDGRFWRPLRGKLKHTFGGLAAGHRSPGPEPPTVFAIQGLATSGAVFKRCISRLRLNPGGGKTQGRKVRSRRSMDSGHTTVDHSGAAWQRKTQPPNTPRPTPRLGNVWGPTEEFHVVLRFY